jgi:hypothetical protein
VKKARPEVVATAQANRYFLTRMVRHLVTQYGIRQFLDIGTGLPGPDNTHEVAQREAPDCRIVYADNDHCRCGCSHALGRSGCLNARPGLACVTRTSLTDQPQPGHPPEIRTATPANEIRRMFIISAPRHATGRHARHWSRWRQRHQERDRHCHCQRQRQQDH